jgi:hypothetical protein
MPQFVPVSSNVFHERSVHYLFSCSKGIEMGSIAAMRKRTMQKRRTTPTVAYVLISFAFNACSAKKHAAQRGNYKPESAVSAQVATLMTGAGIPALPGWPKQGLEPSATQVEDSLQFRFAEDVDVATGLAPLGKSDCEVDLRVTCSTRYFLTICVKKHNVTGSFYVRMGNDDSDTEMGCTGKSLRIIDSSLGDVTLCPRNGIVTEWRGLFEQLERGGLLKIRSRWAAGDSHGPQVLFRMRTEESEVRNISMTSYIGSEAQSERRVVRILNDHRLCFPRPPG